MKRPWMLFLFMLPLSFALVAACDGDTREPCVPATCAQRALDCGTWGDGCGQSLECGSCQNRGFCTERGRCESQWTEMLEQPDGVRLRSQVYLPKDMDGPLPALVYRTPYRSERLQFYYDIVAAALNAQDYALVLQDCRGTNDSEGEWYPFLNSVEGADGRHAVAWTKAQAWCNGRVGTVGTSYEGYTALVAAVDNPDVDFVLADGPGEGLTFYNEGGILSSGMLFYQAGINEDDDDLVWQLSEAATNALELAGLDEALLGHVVPTWRDALAHPSPADSFWDLASLRHEADGICAPVMITHGASFGWAHPDRIFRALTRDSCAEHRDHIWYVLGSAFDHGGAMSDVYLGKDSPLRRMLFALMDHYLRDEALDLDGLPRTQLWSFGDSEPVAVEAWPPQVDDEFLLFPHGDQWMRLEAPEDGVVGELEVDPEHNDPCDVDAVEYTWWSSSPLEDELLVGGLPHLSFQVSGTGLDMDWFWTLMAYDPAANPAQAYRTLSMGKWRARHRNGLETEQPLVPDSVVLMDLDLTATAHRFLPGHSVLLLMQGNMCSYVENPHTAESITAQTHYRPSIHRVHQTAANPSFLSLPVIERISSRKIFSKDLRQPQAARVLSEAHRAWAERNLGL